MGEIGEKKNPRKEAKIEKETKISLVVFSISNDDIITLFVSFFLLFSN